MTLQERFDAKYEIVEPGGCWVWTGAVNSSNYGQIAVRRLDGTYRNTKAHRVSYELAYGPIPPGKGYHGTCVLHRCDNTSCVNPSHLFLGTVADNNRDMVKKGRDSFGEAHGNAKLTDADVANIRQLAGTMTIAAIGVRFGVDRTHVWKLIKRKCRRRIASLRIPPQQNPRSEAPSTSAASRRPLSRRAGGDLHSTSEGAPGDRMRQAGAGGKLADLHADPFRSEAPLGATALLGQFPPC